MPLLPTISHPHTWYPIHPSYRLQLPVLPHGIHASPTYIPLIHVHTYVRPAGMVESSYLFPSSVAFFLLLESYIRYIYILGTYTYTISYISLTYLTSFMGYHMYLDRQTDRHTRVCTFVGLLGTLGRIQWDVTMHCHVSRMESQHRCGAVLVFGGFKIRICFGRKEVWSFRSRRQYGLSV